MTAARKPRLTAEAQAARNAFVAGVVRYEETPDGSHWRVGPGDQRQGQVGRAIGILALRHVSGYEVVLQFDGGKVDTFSPMQLMPETQVAEVATPPAQVVVDRPATNGPTVACGGTM